MTRDAAPSWRARIREARARLALLYGINRRNVDLVYANNPRRHYPLADDKARCKSILEQHGVPVAETLALCAGLFDVDATLSRLRGRGDFVVKPANGSGGDGILVLGARTENGWESARGHEIDEDALRTHLANVVFGAYSKHLEDQALVEARVQAHPFFHALWDSGVCDLRILCLEGRPLLAMLRVPTRRSGGRANLHQGAIGVAVRLADGRTTAARLGGVAVTTHPETGAPLLGLEVPGWADVLRIAVRAAAALPLGYLGVDLVLDATRGPLVLEVNVRPGLEIQNVTGTMLGSALGEVAS